jgi:hypothetical protein
MRLITGYLDHELDAIAPVRAGALSALRAA